MPPPELSERDQARFYAKVALPNEQGCMLWMASTNSGGYGQFKWFGKMRKAHRVSYLLAYGSLPGVGLAVDHLCRVRRCVAPLHLEAVTQAENNRRSGAAKSHCPQGHAYTEANTYRHPETGRRWCRTCVRAAGSRYRARKAA